MATFGGRGWRLAAGDWRLLNGSKITTAGEE